MCGDALEFPTAEISFVGRGEEEVIAAGVPYEVGNGALSRDCARADRRRCHGTQPYRSGRDGARGTGRYFADHVFNYPTLVECYRVGALAGLNELGGACAAGIGVVAPPQAPAFLLDKS